MNNFNIRLRQDDINQFVEAAEKVNCDIDATSENKRFVVDAKSLLGMYAIFGSGKYEITLHTDKETEDIIKFKEEIKKFIKED